ncbi:MAG: sulfite exporter TauE/SafE family protein [Ignavibacteria bacterium]
MTELLPAFVIGFLGSLHCAGMCGPIAIALPVSEQSRLSFYFGRALYNLGRIISYSLIGLVFGFFGGGFALFGFQRDISIVLGILILLSVIIPFSLRNKLNGLTMFNKITNIVKSSFAKTIGKTSKGSMLLIGILNGFLPCGLVYTAVAGAIVTSNAVSGMLFMAVFGLGTFPLMFAATIFGKYINLNLRRKLNRLIPLFTIMLAFIFILRGLNLGIPFISPKFQAQPVAVEVDCCH